MKHVKSKHGEGIGGPVREVTEPDDPSFDPATHKTATDDKIRALMEQCQKSLNAWEMSFLCKVYGQTPLTRKQHINVAKIHRKYLAPPPIT